MVFSKVKAQMIISFDFILTGLQYNRGRVLEATAKIRIQLM